MDLELRSDGAAAPDDPGAVVAPGDGGWGLNQRKMVMFDDF